MSAPNIAEWQARGDVRRLIKALRHKEKSVRRDAARALGKLADPRAVTPLASVLYNGRETEHVRKVAAGALGKMGDCRAVESLLNALTPVSFNMRTPGGATHGATEKLRIGTAVADALVAMGGTAVEPLLAILSDRDEDSDRREQAAQALGEIGDPRAVEPLLAILADSDEDPGVQSRAVSSLGEIGDPRAVEPILAAAQLDRGPALLLNWHFTVVNALVEIGGPSVVEPLRHLQRQDKNPDMRKLATWALEKIGATPARKERSAAPSSPAAAVRAMLAIYVHDPDTLLTDMPSGNRLKPIAAEALRCYNSAWNLSADAYVRTVVTGGGLSMADQEVQARADAPRMMDELLRERGLEAEGYKHEVWTSELTPSVRVVWTAALLDHPSS